MSAIQQVYLSDAKEAVGKLQFGLATTNGTRQAFGVLEHL